MTLPQIPPGRAPVPACYKSEVARRDAQVAELTRRGPIPAFNINNVPWARYQAANGTLPINSLQTVQQWSLLTGASNGITVGTESGGLPNALFTLPVGLWRATVSWILSGGGFDRSLDRCDYWLSQDSGNEHFGNVMAPGYYTATTNASDDIVSDGTTTVKMHFYSTFAWSLNILHLTFYRKA